MAETANARAQRIGEVILALDGVSLAFGGVKALSDVSFDVREHEVRAIIGPNGAGKSSMLNVINGVYHPQQGTIRYLGREYHLADALRARYQAGHQAACRAAAGAKVFASRIFRSAEIDPTRPSS